MGWLELLPLLRRVLPLLDRLIPMLDGMLAGRASARADGDRGGAVAAEITRGNDILLQSIEQQRAQTLALTEEIRRLRLSNEVFAARLDQSDIQASKIALWVKASVILASVLLVLACLLTALLLHRSV